MTRNGIRFSYLDRGRGAAFVFQHGLGGDMSQPAGLYGSGGRLICLECRAHGHTDPLGPLDALSFASFAADLLTLLDHLELGSVMLGGVSMGAGVAVRLAAEHPDRVSGLVLVRPSWFDAPWPEHLHVFDTLAEILSRADREAAKYLLRQTPEYQAVAARSATAAASLLRQCDRPHARERAPVLQRLPGDFPLSGGLSWTAITAPTLVLGTRADPQHPLAIADAIASAVPHAELRELTPKVLDEARHAHDVKTAIDDFAARAGNSRARHEP